MQQLCSQTKAEMKENSKDTNGRTVEKQEILDTTKVKMEERKFGRKKNLVKS
jgi:hypothetical protein